MFKDVNQIIQALQFRFADKIEEMDRNKQIDQAVMMRIAYSFLDMLRWSHYEPLPINQVFSSLQFNIYRPELEPSLSGIMVISDKIREQYGINRIVLLNALDSDSHKRFTLAHELYHYIFDYNDTDYVHSVFTYDTENDNFEEMIACTFAACLLMPEDWFRVAYGDYKKHYGSTYGTIEKLSEVFSCPVTAIGRRMQELAIGE